MSMEIVVGYILTNYSVFSDGIYYQKMHFVKHMHVQ